MNNNPVSDNTKKTFFGKIKDKIKNFRQHKTSKKTPVEQDDKFTIEDGIIKKMLDKTVEDSKEFIKRISPETRDALRGAAKQATEETLVEQGDNFTIEEGSIVGKMLNEIKENPIKMSPETLEALRGTGKLPPKKVNKTEFPASKLVKQTKEIC